MADHDDLDVLVETVLARADEPLSVEAVRKALPAGKKPKKTEAQVRLETLVEAGRAHRWPGKTAKFSAFGSASRLCGSVCCGRSLTRGPSESEIKQRLPSSARSLAKSTLAALIEDRAVLKHPKLGRKQRFGIHPPDAADYLPAEIETAFKRLMKLGFKEAELRSAFLRRYAGGVESAGVPGGLRRCQRRWNIRGRWH